MKLDELLLAFLRKKENFYFCKNILRDFKNFERRLAQRETWLSSSNFEHKYIIDEWDDKWIAENNTYGDIISINASFHGYSKGFSEKLYRWYEFVDKNYPGESLIMSFIVLKEKL